MQAIEATENLQAPADPQRQINGIGASGLTISSNLLTLNLLFRRDFFPEIGIMREGLNYGDRKREGVR
ncbi:MAG: hypothetical protein A4E57_04409 [Syntrophorhabdaceae bacterium PtaU1.Bin034]|nr:MAG: hypothetical protein A4E57_04409 [Syntrophorhabdaceae bacterium PtaU1.Bin034]